MNIRTFLFNQDAFFVRVGEERNLDNQGTIIGKLTEQARIPRVRFDSETSNLDATPRKFIFEAQVTRTKKCKFSAEGDDVSEYLAQVELEISRVNGNYQIRDIRIKKI